MKIRFVVPVVLAGVALAAGVASANPTYWREHGLLLEVSADPRDGTDHVRTNPTRATRLELVALNAPVRLRGITVRFADGRTFSQPMSTIHPGERVVLELPRRAGIIQAVDLEYGRQIVDRTPARLQIVPHDDVRYAPIQRRDPRRYSTPYDRTHRGPRDRAPYNVPSYDRSGPYHSAPDYTPGYTPSYKIEPRPGWSGTIEGSFRF